MTVFASYALSPINFILIFLCLNNRVFFHVESLMNNEEWLSWPALDGKRLKFALFISIFLEVVFFVVQVLILGVVTSPRHNKQWAIKKSQLSYPSPASVSNCIKEVSISHLLRPFLIWMAYPLYVWRGASMSSSDFPSNAQIMYELVFSVIMDDTLFYWAHRYLHENKWLYRTVHKKHHEFHHNIGINTEYAHPVEDFLSNVLPPFAGPFLLRSHICVCVAFFAIKLWQSVDAHSGFVLPFPLTPWNLLPGMDCARAHDYHHSHNVGNYGGFFMFWDWLCGSDKAYKKYTKQEVVAIEKDN